MLVVVRWCPTVPAPALASECSSSVVLQPALFATPFSSASGELVGHGLPAIVARLEWVVDVIAR